MSAFSLLRRVGTVIQRDGLFAVPQKAANVIARLYRQSTFKPFVVEKQFAGVDFKFYISDIWAEEWYLFPEDDKPELHWLRDMIKPGMTVVDCGVHHGFLTLLFSRWVGPEGRVFSFEALPQNVAVIERNLELNNIENVTLIGKAVGAKEGSVQFETQNFGIRDSNGHIPKEGAKGNIEVPMTTLDASLGNTKIDFMKIDVEGHEIAVLKGATGVLRSKPALDVEIHSEALDHDPKAIAELLALIDADRYSCDIQLKIDGPIVKSSTMKNLSETIAREDNVHLFAR